MTRWLVAIVVFLPWFTPSRAQAQQVHTVKDVTINSYFSPQLEPLVNSFARSILYNQFNNRIYNVQVILGHLVIDETDGYRIFQAQIVSDIGYANSNTGLFGDLPAIGGHCYDAAMVSHVNAYNLHEGLASGLDCVPDRPGSPGPPPKDNCPILLDLAQDGFHLSGPDPAVSFDINADGTPDRIAWTQAGGDDAFLCLDRNHNGVIDDGRELFGFATPLLSGKPAKIGYLALAELDDPQLGGNRDGKIDAQDAMFRDLCVWIDKNRNGISEPSEIFTLDQVGVVALEYTYKDLHLTDTFGNLFRYTSRVFMRTPSGAVKPWPTFDVVFAEAH